MRDYVRDTLAGKLDDQLVYRKRLRRPLGDYERNVPPQRARRAVADEFNRRQGRPLQYQNGGWISYVMTIAGPGSRSKRCVPRSTMNTISRVNCNPLRMQSCRCCATTLPGSRPVKSQLF